MGRWVEWSVDDAEGVEAGDFVVGEVGEVLEDLGAVLSEGWGGLGLGVEGVGAVGAAGEGDGALELRVVDVGEEAALVEVWVVGDVEGGLYGEGEVGVGLCALDEVVAVLGGAEACGEFLHFLSVCDAVGLFGPGRLEELVVAGDFGEPLWEVAPLGVGGDCM